MRVPGLLWIGVIEIRAFSRGFARRESVTTFLHSTLDHAKIDRNIQNMEVALKNVMQAGERIESQAHARKKVREKLQELEVLAVLLSERVPNARMKSIKKQLTCLRAWNRS